MVSLTIDPEKDLSAPHPGASPKIGFAARVIEASWLAAVALVPLVFEVRGLAAFQTIKIAAVQVAGVIIWLALLAQAGGFLRGNTLAASWHAVLGHASRFLPFLVLACVWTVSAIFSVDRAASFWGSPEYCQGWQTMAALFGIVVGLAVNLRSRAQVDRLVVTALAAAVPVAFYAFVQRAGWDPILFDNSMHRGAFSFAGQPIFMAGYLLMLLPLGVWRVWSSFSEQPAGRLRPSLDVGILVVLAAGFVSAEKRGPMVALVAAVACGLALLAAYRHRARLAIWGVAIVLLAAILATALALIAKENGRIRRIPIVGPLSMIVPVSTETGDPFRRQLWKSAPKVIFRPKAFIFPDQTVDSRSWLRPVIGYGPETLVGVLPQTFVMHDLPDRPLELRFHNHGWDTLVQIGVLGGTALLWVYASVFSAGFAALGFRSMKFSPLVFFLAALAAGGVGAVVMMRVYDSGYGAMGFQFGFAGGLVAAALWAGLRRTKEQASGGNLSRDFLLIAFLAGILANWIDLAFVFPTAATLLLVCVFVGAVQALSEPAAEAPGESNETCAPSGRLVEDRQMPTTTAGALVGVLSGSMLAAMLHGFINLLSFTPTSVGAVLNASLLQLRVDGGPSHLLLFLFVPSWVAVNVSLYSAGRRRVLAAGAWKGLATAGAVSVLIAVAYSLLRAQWIVMLGPIPPASETAQNAIAQARGWANMSIAWLATFGITIVALAALFYRGQAGARRWPFAPASVGMVAALALAAAALLWQTAASMLALDVMVGWGNVLLTFDRKLLAGEVYESNLKDAPRAFPSRLAAANAFLDHAEAHSSDLAGSPEVERAAELLTSGRPHGELNTLNYHLGRLYLRWALVTKDPAQIIVRSILAREAFGRALTFCPDSAVALYDAVVLDNQLWRDKASVESKLAHADELTRTATEESWGNYYAVQSFAAPEARLKEAYARRAIAYLTRSLEFNPDGGSKLTALQGYRALVTLGTLYRNVGERDSALRCFESALQVPTNTPKWEAEGMLAETYADLHVRDLALAHLENALQSASPEARPQLLILKRRLSRVPPPR